MIGTGLVQRHEVGRLVWTVDVEGADRGLRLQARLAELSLTLFQPIIDRVLSRCLPADRHAFLSRLTLDLGELPELDFEHAAAQALERALADALSAALMGLGETASETGDRILSEGMAQLALVRHYLVYGTVPYGLDHGPFDPEAVLAATAEGQPKEMAAMLRRLAAERQVVERLVHQAREATLRRLLEVLEPAHAELILAYFKDLGRLHHEAPVVPLGDRDFIRLLWVLTLRFLIDETGSQFNRKSYLGTLLRNVASAVGVDFRDLLISLRRGMDEIRRRVPITASLPAVLNELLQEAVGEGLSPAPESPTEISHGNDSIAAMLERDPAGLVALIRGLIHDRPALRRLIETLTSETLSGLLILLDREHAPLIRDFLADVTEAHRVKPLVPLAPSALHRLLWVLTIVQLARDSGSQFNRKSFLQTLLRDLADHESVDFTNLLITLRRGIEQIVQRVSPSGSFLGLLDVLLRELAPGLSAEALAAAESYLRSGIWPGYASPGHLLRLTRTDPAGLAALIRGLAENESSWSAVAGRLLDALTPQEITALLSPGDEDGVEALVELLWGTDPRDERAEWIVLLRRLALGRGLADGTSAQDALFLVMTAGSDGLLRLARSDPARLSALMRGQAEDETAWNAVAGRLLERLTPREMVALLSPGDEDKVEALAERLRAIDPRDERAAWIVLLRRLALGRGLADGASAGDSPALAMKSGGRGLHQFDRSAALIHLLRTGVMPWWAALCDPPFSREAALMALPELPVDQLRRLFAEAEPGERQLMAQRLVGLVGGDGVRRLLNRLAPWATNPRGPFAQISPDKRDSVQAHLLVAVLEGGDIELGALLAQAGGMEPGYLPRWDGGAGVIMPRDMADWSLDALLFAMCDPSLPSHGEEMERMLSVLLSRYSSVARILANRLPPAVRSRLVRLLPKQDAGAEIQAAVLAFLRGETVPSIDEDVLIEAAITLADSGDEAFREALMGMMRQARLRAFWTTRLPNRLIARLVRLSEPRRARVLIDTIEILGAAWRDIAPLDHSARTRLPWAALLDFLVEHPREEREPRSLVGKVVAALVGKDEASGQRLLTRARDLARTIGHAWLPAVLQAVQRPSAPSSQPPAGIRPPSRPMSGRSGTETVEVVGTFHYINNAGLVLVGSFLPHLFKTLDLLGEGADGKPEIRDAASLSRAVHLLQWLVDGRTDRPESSLLLNKILCGQPLSAVIEPSIQPADSDIALCDLLLKSILARWKIISSTSIAGLRETFLQREGRLELRDQGWSLVVQRKTLDVLVDKVPWGISMISNPWQSTPLLTTW